MAAAGGLIRLQRQVPLKVEAEIALTGEPVSASRAYELGLVNRVAAAGTVLEETLRPAERIAANAPPTLRWRCARPSGCCTQPPTPAPTGTTPPGPSTSGDGRGVVQRGRARGSGRLRREAGS